MAPSHQAITDEALVSGACVVGVVKLRDAVDLKPKELAKLAQLPQLSFLDLSDAAIDSAGLAELLQCPNIRHLCLDGTDLTSKDFVALSQFPRLSYLRIDPNQVSDNWEFLNGLPALRTLTIQGKSLPDVDAIGRYHRLRTVEFSGTEEVSNASVKTLQDQNPRLTIRYRADPDSDVIETLGINPLLEASTGLKEAGWKLRYGDGHQWDGSESLQWTQIRNANTPFAHRLKTRELEWLLSLGHPGFHVLTLSGSRDLEYLPEFFVGQRISHLELCSMAIDDSLLLEIGRHSMANTIVLSNTDVTRKGVVEFQSLQPTCRIITSFGDFPAVHRMPEIDNVKSNPSSINVSEDAPNASATDAQIMALIESSGGSVYQYQDAGEIRVRAADTPSLSAYRNNFLFTGQSGFVDTALIQLAGLLKQRPDISVVCFHCNGTPITNAGLRSLKGIPIGQVMIQDTNVVGGLIASERSDFSIGEWSVIPGMTEAGYVTFFKDARLSGVTMEARSLTAPVIAAINASNISIIHFVESEASPFPNVEVLRQFTSVDGLRFYSDEKIPLEIASELHKSLPQTEIRYNHEM